MRFEILEDVNAVATAGARIIAAEARAAVAGRKQFTLAVSGGDTPTLMLRALAREDVPWNGVHLVQVDERVAPDGNADRNLTHLRENLLDHVPLSPEQIHAMPVELPDLALGARTYARALEKIAGSPAVLDLVHLGLGLDGHTASLVPGDPVLDVMDSDVSPTGPYQNWRRLTLTYPILNRARKLLWIVTGREKSEMLMRLLNGDVSIPAGRIRRDHALLFTDRSTDTKPTLT